MLPARPRHAVRLADVLTDSLAALGGEAPATAVLGLPPVRHAIVVLVDGLGAAALRERSGHARTLASRLDRRAVADTVFPSTTAAALATLTTGVDPGRHGFVGYSVLDREHDRVLNLLRGWDALAAPERWQAVPTVFERAGGEGVDALAIGPAKYAGSAFGRAILRGARYLGEDRIPSRLEAAVAHAHGPDRTLDYVYVPELDTASHRHGTDSEAWIAALETVDQAVRDAAGALRRDTAMIVTADHGAIDVPAHAHRILSPASLRGVRHVAGEPRGLQLHLEGDADPVLVADAIREEIGATGWVVTRAEAIDQGLFGVVEPAIESRIGDLIVGARRRVAYYAREDDRGRRMIGQHGSLSDEELVVPLLRFGAGSD